MHTARLAALGADPAVAAALRPGAPLEEGRLDAVRAFTLRVLDTAGEAGEESLAEFLGHGFTRRNALEIVLGIGAYTTPGLAAKPGSCRIIAGRGKNLRNGVAKCVCCCRRMGRAVRSQATPDRS
jgi:hypothetical protein